MLSGRQAQAYLSSPARAAANFPQARDLVEVFVPAFSAQVSFGKLSARERTMHLTINGEEKQVPDQLTVLQLLQHLQITGPVAVERNQSIVPRAQHGTAALKDGDQLEIVHFVGGG